MTAAGSIKSPKYFWNNIPNKISLLITWIFHGDVLNLIPSVEQIHYTGAIRDVKMSKIIQMIIRIQD